MTLLIAHRQQSWEIATFLTSFFELYFLPAWWNTVKAIILRDHQIHST